MKVFVLIAVFAALVVGIYLNRPVRPKPLPYRLLQAGETNPPLTQVGSTWPLPPGAKIWFKTNQLPCGIVTSSDDNLVYLKDPIDGSPFTFDRHHISKNFTDVKP